MVTTEEALDSKEVLLDEGVGFAQLTELRRFIHCHIDKRTELERTVADWDSLVKNFSNESKAETRRGVALWVLGQVEQAVPVLDASRVSKEKHYFLGICYLDLGRNQDALEQLKEASKTDSSDEAIQVAYAEARLKTEDYEGARSLLDRLSKKYEENGDVPYLLGLWHDMQGFREQAMESYDKALVVDPGHPRSLFRMAYMHDLRGDDAAAMEYYQQLRKLRPLHVNTMINLGVIHEDRGEFEEAVDCYRSILDYFPNHSRARLYYGDAMAALNMFYDEEAARRDQKLQQLMSQPVSDISFSPRVRGALEKLDIHTLGDLVSRSEEELLTIPNFGKTSLRELREYLTSKGLNLSSGDTPGGLGGEGGSEGGAGSDPLSRPLAEFEWSGRVEGLIETLNINTVGDLIQRTKKELLEMKNVGQTSIDEIEKRLAVLGLSLPD